MRETPRRRIEVTSSLNEISEDKLGNRVVDISFKDDISVILLLKVPSWCIDSFQA
jgi:hypothetical protein